MTRRFLAPWFVRRCLYVVVTVVLVALAMAGVINESQIDGLLAQITAIGSPLLGAIFTTLAAANTHEGADSTVTVRDVAEVAQGWPQGGSHAEQVDYVIDTMQEYARQVRGE